MATDLFGRNVQFGGAFSSDSTTLSFPALAGIANGSVGLMVNGIAMQYTQPVNMIFELGSPNFYFVGGRPQGVITMNRLAGPHAVQEAFLKKYGDLCADNEITLNMSFKCFQGLGQKTGAPRASADQAGWTARYCVISQYNVRGTSQDGLVLEDVSMMFGVLEMTGGQGKGRSGQSLPTSPGQLPGSGGRPRPGL